MDVKRYDPGMTYDPQPEGEYVLYSDYAALLADLTALREAVREYRFYHEHGWPKMPSERVALDRKRRKAYSYMLRLANQTGDTDHADQV